MPRLVPATLGVIVAWVAVAGTAPATAEDFVFHHENVMGTSLELHLQAHRAEAASLAEARVLAEVDRLAKILSNHDPESEFSRWQAAPRSPSRVSPELFAVLNEANHWSDVSGGAFRPSVDALTRLWEVCESRGTMPTARELDVARVSVNRLSWRLDAGTGTAEKFSDVPLSLDAIAKGFIVERACASAMESNEILGAMLNVGGDLRVMGDSKATLAVANPFADSEEATPISEIVVKDRAVATSGRSQRNFRIAGRRYSHILDPRSGQPVAGVAGATVIAERSADADALATILNVLDPAEGLRLVGHLPGVACLIVGADGRRWPSEEWASYVRAEEAPLDLPEIVRQDPTPATPADEYETFIEFEINQPEGQRGRYRRPYVAVWVEDKDGFPVRTLILWLSQGGAGPDKWVPDLKRWYRADQQRKDTDEKDLVHMFSRPTRPPGKYSTVWDGKDADGKPLPPGEYTVFVEAAREHGTNQGIRHPLTLGGEPFSEELKGNVEIRSASLSYRRKAPAK